MVIYYYYILLMMIYDKSILHTIKKLDEYSRKRIRFRISLQWFSRTFVELVPYFIVFHRTKLKRFEFGTVRFESNRTELFL